MAWNRKHLLDIESLSADEIVTVLDTARAFKAVGERAIKKVPALRGKTVVNLFVEPSTRTRISFELAAQRLTADVINFTAEASSLKKGETLKDTARNLEALNVDIIVMRHSASGAPHFLSRFLRASVINAGDGAHEHPTQALLDLFTIREKKGKIEGLNVTILGDILYSRVARSNIWALTKLGARVTLVRPGHAGAAGFRADGLRGDLQCRGSHRAGGHHQSVAHSTRAPAQDDVSQPGGIHQPVRLDQGPAGPGQTRARSSCTPARSTAAWRLTAK